jgi:hypothetical protein
MKLINLLNKKEEFYQCFRLKIISKCATLLGFQTQLSEFAYYTMNFNRCIRTMQGVALPITTSNVYSVLDDFVSQGPLLERGTHAQAPFSPEHNDTLK